MSNTLAAPQGSINWTQSLTGLEADGGGQKLVVTNSDGSDGSWQNHADYSLTGQVPYLSMSLASNQASRTVAFSIAAGSSQLVLTIAGIDVRVTSGTATLAGTWNGVAVNWTGHADLTSNPVVTHPIAGWPIGAFASQLEQAAFFSPLGKSLAPSILAAQKATAPPGTQMRSAWGVLGRAGAWCAGGALATSETGPAALLGCAGGAGASILGDLVSWIDSDDPPAPPPTPGEGSQAPPPPQPPVAPEPPADPDPPLVAPPADPPSGPVSYPGDGLDNDGGGGDGGSGGGGDPLHRGDGVSTTLKED